MTSDLEADMLDAQIGRDDKIFLAVVEQLMDCRPGKIIFLPEGHPLTRKPGQFD